MSPLERNQRYIEDAIEWSGGTCDWSYVQSQIEQGYAQLWEGQGCAAVTRLETYATGLKTCLVWLAGGEKDSLGGMADLERRIAQWAAQLGYKRMEIVGRRGWLKALPDYRESRTIMIKDL